MRLGGWVKLGVVAVLVVVGGSLAYGWAQGNHAARLDEQLARQRSARLEAEARAMGWEAQWATVVPDLLAQGAEKDTMIARLRESVRLAGGHTVARTVVQATAERDTVLVADTVYVGGAHVHHIDLPPFFGVAQCRPPETLELSLGARIQTELIGTIAPDGRLLVTARSPDPGVQLVVQQLAWDPPEREGQSFWSRAAWTLGAAAVGAAGWEMLR